MSGQPVYTPWLSFFLKFPDFSLTISALFAFHDFHDFHDFPDFQDSGHPVKLSLMALQEQACFHFYSFTSGKILWRFTARVMFNFCFDPCECRRTLPYNRLSTLTSRFISRILISKLKCHYGFSKNDFSGKFDQWRARRKKIFRIGFVVCHQFTFKIRRFWFTTAQNRSPLTNDVKGGTDAKWPESFSVVYMQELSKPWAQCKLFKGYPSSFILLQIV